ncbi:response regulator [Desulfolutivibrio sulfoxidireducens]|nr:response regulator [Desulfolutivibrio sulfoxidireducens]
MFTVPSCGSDPSMRFRFIWPRGLRNQLFILVLLVLVPALGLAVYSGLRQRQAAIAESKERIMALVRLFAYEQDQLVDTTHHVLQTLGHIPEIRNRDIAATDRILAEVHAHTPFYATLVAVNLSGEVFGCALPAAKPINVADREWFDAVKRDKTFFVGRYLISRSARKASLPMAFAVLDARGEVDFILGAALDLEYYADVYAKTSLPPEASLTLADAGGTILYRNMSGPQWVGKPLPDHLRGHLDKTAMEGTFTAEGLDETVRIYGFKRISADHDLAGGEPLTVIVGLPEAQALEKPRRILLGHLAGLAVAALVAMTAAGLFAHRTIFKPVSALARAARRVKEGEASARTGLEYSQGEIGALARDFDEMAEALAGREQERDAARLELEEQVAFVRTLVEAAPIPIYHKDRYGRFVGCNRAFAEFVGMSEDEIRGAASSDIAPPVLSARNMARDAELMARGGSESYEATFPSPGGQERQVVFHKAVYRDAAGEVAGLVGLFVDVTPLKQAQAELIAAKERAEEASRGKSEFLASMSHEIRTPLNGVLGMLQVLLSEPLEQNHRHYVETALDAARTLMSVIGEVLDFSKIEAGRMELAEEDFRVAGLLDAVTGLFGAQSAARGIELAGMISPGVPGWARGDQGRLRQILFNLVGNALKFTEAGRILVRVDRAVEAETPGDTVLDLVVEDTGVGIPEDARERVFEPFRQAGYSAKRHGQGTGLGLPIVKRVAEAMGGFVTLDSEEGRGTRIAVRVRLRQSLSGAETPGPPPDFPAAPPPPHPAASVASSPAVAGEAVTSPNVPVGAGRTPRHQAEACRPGGLRVLVVEDDDLNRLTTTKLLERLGCEAVGVPGGSEALDLLETRPFDAVFMDIQMPGMDGLEATRRIRAATRPEVARLFVVAVTAHALKGDRERFLEAGMDDYVSKPVDLDELCAALARVPRRQPEKDAL